MKKQIKKIATGTLILFAGIGIGQTYHLVHDIVEPKESIKQKIEETVDNLFDKEKFDEFMHPEKQTEPSCTNLKGAEAFGKKVDELLGIDKSWDETSGIDTYGESWSAVIDLMVNGQYVSQKPSKEEMKEFIDEDYEKVNYKIELIKEERKLSYFENFDKVISMFFVGDYKTDKFNEATKYIKENYDFINGKEIYHNRNITFEELDYATKLYFIDQVLKMDRDMKKILPNYTDYLNDDKYNNISEDLYTIGNELMKTKRR